MPDDSKLETIPVGSLGIVAHKSCTKLGEKVDHYLVKWRANRKNENKFPKKLSGNEYVDLETGEIKKYMVNEKKTEEAFKRNFRKIPIMIKAKPTKRTVFFILAIMQILSYR